MKHESILFITYARSKPTFTIAVNNSNHNQKLIVPNLSLNRYMLIGGSISFFVIAFFLLQVKHPKPEWGSFWMVRPLLIVPLAGATGGACYYVLMKLRFKRGRKKVWVYILGIFIYLAGVWMGIILGLDGTLWN
jgi:hypothetical protein